MRNNNLNQPQGGNAQGAPNDGNIRFEGQFQNDWIITGIDRNGIAYADALGKYIQNKKLTRSQIRNVFGEIKRIEMKGYDDPKSKISFLLLKPKMAYAASRQTNDGLKELKKMFDKAHGLVTDKVTFNNFVNLFEAVLAYHKSYGGKD